MNPPHARPLLAALVVLASTSCASAGKRLEQGHEAEASGDYRTAVSRYVEALEKDPELIEARDALQDAWDAALIQGSAFARDARTAGDPLAAADEILALDGLRDLARTVDVSLGVPPEYPHLRRTTLDAAIDALMTRGDGLRRDRSWGDARNAYRRVIDELDPGESQRRNALDAQAETLLAWAEEDAGNGRFRSAWDRAGEALSVAPELPQDVARAAVGLQERALSAGLKVLAVFPVEATAEAREGALTDLEAQLADILETDHWRRPPLFVAVAAPAAVRRITRRLSPPGRPLRPRVVLDEVGADFGALVTLVEVVGEERNVRSTEREARTNAGEPASYTLIRGRIRYTMVAEVTLFDGRGARLHGFRVRASDEQDFRRARTSADFEELDLSRGERLLFNPGEERRLRAIFQGEILDELAEDLAERLFEETLRRIP